MLSVENWAEVRRQHQAEGMPIKTIARVMGISRNTVRAALRRDGPPKYERTVSGSIVDDVEPRVRGSCAAASSALPTTEAATALAAAAILWDATTFTRRWSRHRPFG